MPAKARAAHADVDGGRLFTLSMRVFLFTLVKALAQKEDSFRRISEQDASIDLEDGTPTGR